MTNNVKREGNAELFRTLSARAVALRGNTAMREEELTVHLTLLDQQRISAEQVEKLRDLLEGQ